MNKNWNFLPFPKRAAPAKTHPVPAALLPALGLALGIATTSLADSADDLVKAAREGDLRQVQRLVAGGADVNTPTKYGNTALQTAASFGKTDVVKELIAKGANVNAMDKDRNTALHLATAQGKAEVVKILLENHAIVNLYNKKSDGSAVKEQTALEIAVENRNMEIQRLLRGATPPPPPETGGGAFLPVEHKGARELQNQSNLYFADLGELASTFGEERKDRRAKLRKDVAALEGKYKQDGNVDGTFTAHEVLNEIDDPFTSGEINTPVQRTIPELKRLVDTYAGDLRALDSREKKEAGILNAKHVARLKERSSLLLKNNESGDARALYDELKRLEQWMARNSEPEDEPKLANQPRTFVDDAKAPEAPAKRAFYSVPEIKEQITKLGGTTLVIKGAVKEIEKNPNKRNEFFLKLEGDLKVSIPLPANTALTGKPSRLETTTVTETTYSSSMSYTYKYSTTDKTTALAAKDTVGIEVTINKLLTSFYVVDSYQNARIVASNKDNVRRAFNAVNCGMPCAVNSCAVCSPRE